MNKLLIVSLGLLLTVLSGCGSGGETPAAPTEEVQKNSHGCAMGEFYNTNGMRDFISVGTDNLFHMERSGGSATGFVSCNGNHFTLTITASTGGCTVANGCATYPSQENHTVNDVGEYQCQYAIANRTFTVYCVTPSTPGNVFSTGMQYFLPNYY